jgi:hypothetical protein
MSNMESEQPAQQLVHETRWQLLRDPVSAKGTWYDVQQEFYLQIYFQFTAKTLNQQAKRAQKDENAEKARLKKVITLLLLILHTAV